MTEVTLHPTPRQRDVVREQIRVAGLILRREALFTAVVLAIVSIVIGINIVRGTAETWFDSDEWFPIGIGAFFLPFAVWRGERRFGPAFLWTLPVDRRRLALARVFAGWVWLMAALAAFVLWLVVLALLSRVPNAETISLFAFVGATAAYLFGSAFVLGLRHPLRWLLGAVGVLVLLRFFHRAVDEQLSTGPLRFVFDHFGTFWTTLSGPAQWILATFFWLGCGLLALWAAVSRHGEHRRH